MPEYVENTTILMADADEEDCLMTLQSVRENKIIHEIYFVHDGEQLCKFLKKKAPYGKSRRPGFLLLDMNMPRFEGKAVLQYIKADPELCSIPIIALLASHVEEDILKSHELDVDGFLVKPINCERLIDLMKETSNGLVKQAS